MELPLWRGNRQDGTAAPCVFLCRTYFIRLVCCRLCCRCCVVALLFCPFFVCAAPPIIFGDRGDDSKSRGRRFGCTLRTIGSATHTQKEDGEGLALAVRELLVTALKRDAEFLLNSSFHCALLNYNAT